jgi:hypothetical protein
VVATTVALAITGTGYYGGTDKRTLPRRPECRLGLGEAIGRAVDRAVRRQVGRAMGPREPYCGPYGPPACVGKGRPMTAMRLVACLRMCLMPILVNAAQTGAPAPSDPQGYCLYCGLGQR